MHSILPLALLSFCFFGLIHSLNNGLALTPPMGWMTWQRFRCNTDCDTDPLHCIRYIFPFYFFLLKHPFLKISENLIKRQADMLVSEGYLSHGYQYIIVDDCWLATSRDPSGRLQPDPKRFPSGIKALADYVHSKGLKFGIYEDYGTQTCAGFPGSLNYLEADAKIFAEWGVDYLKLDGCNSDIQSMDSGYPLMGQYLNATGRPMVYSCSWPAYQEGTTIHPNYTKIAEYCNLWRNWDDIQDSYASLNSIIGWFDGKQSELALVHGPGNWNDPDMLLIGNFGLSMGQSQTQMALWAVMAAPLIMSVDLNEIKPWFKAIIQNEELIRINQDALGKMGNKFMVKNGVQFWKKELINNEEAIVLYNSQPYGTPSRISTNLKELGLMKGSCYEFKEVFNGKKEIYREGNDFELEVNPSGSVLAFRVTPVECKQWRFFKN